MYICYLTDNIYFVTHADHTCVQSSSLEELMSVIKSRILSMILSQFSPKLKNISLFSTSFLYDVGYKVKAFLNLLAILYFCQCITVNIDTFISTHQFLCFASCLCSTTCYHRLWYAHFPNLCTTLVYKIAT